MLAATGSVAHLRTDEGALTTPMLARVPAGIERGRVSFEHGDAQALRTDLGSFDVVLAARSFAFELSDGVVTGLQGGIDEEAVGVGA